MNQQVYLGIDLGAESGRVMAGCWNGRQMRVEELHRFANGAVELAGTLRWDVLRLWGEVQRGLSLAAKRFGNSIKSIGVDTWGVDYVLLSKSGEILGWPFCYRDSRTRGCLDAGLKQLSRAEIFANTGAQFMEINTLYQWLAHQRASPEVFAAADSFLMIPDWFNWCLTGEKCVEFTNATTTQFFHPAKRAWSVEMLERLGLPTNLLPAVIEPGTRLGALRESVCERTGLSRVPVVAPATHDTGSAVAAVPTEFTGRSNWAYISSGTWSLVGIEAREPVLSARALELNVTNEGGVDGTWRVLKNVMGLWLVQRCRAAFEARGGTADYGAFVKLAETATPLRCFVNPDDRRFLNPPDMPAAMQLFCQETNQRPPETEGELVRCVLESLALKYSVVLSELEELNGQRIEVVHIVGGGARNALLNQFTADACERPVIAGPVEATVLGNVLVQARTFGELDSLAELRATVRASSELTRFDPQPNAAACWKAARERFGELLQCGP
jgi:rhamnulokinase